jgi:hypothetical protein
VDLRGRVVVLGAGARVDRHDQPVPLGQRRRFVGRPHPGRLLGADPPPVRRGRGQCAAHRKPRDDVPGVVHADVHPGVADAERHRRERGAGQRALHGHAGDERRGRGGVPAGEGEGHRGAAQCPLGPQIGHVRPDPAEEPLEDDVDQRAGHRHRAHPADRAAAQVPLAHAEQDAQHEPEPAVVGERGEAAQPAVGRRGGESPDERVQPRIEVMGAAHARTLVEAPGPRRVDHPGGGGLDDQPGWSSSVLAQGRP